MGSIFVIRGLLIYIYAFDHNPPHIHVKGGGCDFTITLKDRIVEGKAKSKHISDINKFMDVHMERVGGTLGKGSKWRIDNQNKEVGYDNG